MSASGHEFSRKPLPRRGIAGAALAFGAALLIWTDAAAAHGDGASGKQLPVDAPAVSPDGEKAKADLAGLVAAAGERLSLLKSAIGKSRTALSRAHGASLAGDTEGAKLLSGVALAWSQAASALLGAADSEGKAAEAEKRAFEATEAVKREKTLLAETELRKQQLTVEVAKSEALVTEQISQGVAAERDKRGGSKAQPNQKGQTK